MDTQNDKIVDDLKIGEYSDNLKSKILAVSVVAVVIWAVIWALFALYYPHHRPMIVFLSIFSTMALSLIAVAFKKPEITGLNGSFNLFFSLVLIVFFLVYALNFLKLDDLIRDKDLMFKFQNYIFSLETKNKRANEIIQRLEKIASETEILQEFYTLSVDARSYDRKAIKKLTAITKNQKHKFHIQAARTLVSINSGYYYFDYTGLNSNWDDIIGEETTLASASLPFLIEKFHKQDIDWPKKVQILQYLHSQARFDRLKKYQFIFETVKNASNMRVAEYALYFLKIREKNRGRYKGKEVYKLTIEEIDKITFENWLEKYYQLILK